MHRSRVQPKHTRLPRLHEAKPHDRTSGATPEHKLRTQPTPRVNRGRTFRLRNVHRD